MQDQGYAWTPGIHSREQVEGWRLVTEAVHQARGLIFSQLWHVGRISHPALQPDQMLPVAPSVHRERERRGPAGSVRGAARPADRGDALSGPAILARARNTMAAGFDGIEVHGANG